MLPVDALTAIIEASGTINVSAISNAQKPFTVLGLEISQANLQSNTSVSCDWATSTIPILTNFAKSTVYVEMNQLCPAGSSLVVHKTGNDQSESVINYVYEPRIGTTSSTQQYFAGGISYGDAVISAFLFLNFAVALVTLMWLVLKRTKVRIT